MLTRRTSKLLQCASQNSFGFTLIELLVVIIITSILAAISLPAFLSRANSARQAEAKTYIGTLNRAQQAYAIEHAQFASNPVTLGIAIRDSTNYKYEIKVGGNGTPYAIHYADSRTGKLHAYVGMTALIQSNGNPSMETVLCEAINPTGGRASDPIYSPSSVECSPGTQNLAKN
ncbi:MAG: prepilin-type N-terminal cleavage/methylation domain-containing protein [Leptolyngbyaceae cyanobacterium CAN_BIN12]|nr:prepilin-type N-terminal cleavage/methylation domain-containing protein [Leptolyngbyaceae cyanobacterium CAN_BIN12]